jgi:hypothetical protein
MRLITPATKPDSNAGLRAMTATAEQNMAIMDDCLRLIDVAIEQLRLQIEEIRRGDQ